MPSLPGLYEIRSRGEWPSAKEHNRGVGVPMIPTPVDQLGRRAFAFYPAIVGIEHNQWTLRRIGGSEIQVMNRKTSQELWIPRRFVGEVSATGQPFIIVGLAMELEFKGGAVLPHRRRVIEMPRAVNGGRGGLHLGQML